ncbi:MAG: hypothetical protein CL808_06760 [Citromicrobium sp.]|nr:hypothetical protein [Citromicrobium sp.]
MKEGGLAEQDHIPDESDAKEGGLTSSAAFPALVALWFAALFGGGCLFLPPVLFDMLLGGAAPFGPQTRLVFALGAAGIGLLMGLFIARQVRTESPESSAAAPPKPRKSGTRPPLDIRSALGLPSVDDDDDEHESEPASEETAFDESAFDETVPDDDVRAPIDDPHFASAWSDADAYDLTEFEHPEEDEADAPPAPVSYAFADQGDEEWDGARQPPHPATAPPRPSRYNPFADFVREDEEEPVAPRPFEAEAEAEEDRPFEAPPRAEPIAEPRAHAAPPPPPRWPEPRAEEPTLNELGVAELVERLARALQGEERPQEVVNVSPPRSGQHRHESALAPMTPPPGLDVDREMRAALDRLSRLDDVA